MRPIVTDQVAWYMSVCRSREPCKSDKTLVAIRITVWIQGLFSGFVTNGRYGKWLTDIHSFIRQTADGDTGRTCLGEGIWYALSQCFWLCLWSQHEAKLRHGIRNADGNRREQLISPSYLNKLRISPIPYTRPFAHTQLTSQALMPLMP